MTPLQHKQVIINNSSLKWTIGLWWIFTKPDTEVFLLNRRPKSQYKVKTIFLN